MVETTIRITEEAIIDYQDVLGCRANMNHLYVEANNDPVQQELPTDYRLTVDEVHAIINDWEDDWKNPNDKLGSS